MNDPARLNRWERQAEWPLAIIALAFLGAYSIHVLVQPGGAAQHVIHAVAISTWVVFAVDYAARLRLAPDRWRWFVRHPLDLAVVALPLLRPLRLVRLVILVTALQKVIGHAIRGRVLVYAAAGTVLVVYVAALAVLQSERADPQANITGFGKALFWAMVTIATVGYGNLYPVTTGGRVVAVLLMVGGVCLLGTVTATIASWMVERVGEGPDSIHAVTAARVDEVRDEIRLLREDLTRIGDQPDG